MATRMRKRSMERAMAELRSMFVEGLVGEDAESDLCLLAIAPPDMAATDMLGLVGGICAREGWWRHWWKCVREADGSGGVYETWMVACAVLYYTL